MNTLKRISLAFLFSMRTSLGFCWVDWSTLDHIGKSQVLTRSDDDLGPWYVLHTRHRQEERAAANLTAWGVEVFLPWLCRTGEHARRELLFPCYLLARCAPSKIAKLMFTRGVLSVVHFGGKPAVLSVSVVEDIRRRCTLNYKKIMHNDFKAGDRVVIREGPFQALIGIFQRETTRADRVRILLCTAESSTTLEIDRDQLQPELAARPA